MLDFAIIPITMIFMGCCTNVISIELIIKQDSSQSQLVTFAQFLFVAFISFLTNLQWKRVLGPIYLPCGFIKRKIPLKTYSLMVFIFFVVSVLNNLALSFNISLPFHMIFRSSSLLSTVIISMLFYKRQFTMREIISLLLVTIGITIATLNSVPEHKKKISFEETDTASIITFVIGITMLTIAMFLSSVLGLIQESSYKQFGKDCHRETIFYSHFLSLPLFVFFLKDLTGNIMANNQSPPLGWDVSYLPILNTIPSQWFYLLVNVVTQYVCIQGVFILTGKTSTLTCTLVISIRKFISIILSVWYFQNPFTPTLWISTILVLVGTFFYSDPFNSQKNKVKTK